MGPLARSRALEASTFSLFSRVRLLIDRSRFSRRGCNSADKNDAIYRARERVGRRPRAAPPKPPAAEKKQNLGTSSEKLIFEHNAKGDSTAHSRETRPRPQAQATAFVYFSRAARAAGAASSLNHSAYTRPALRALSGFRRAPFATCSGGGSRPSSASSA